jgi:putative transposase
MLPCRRVKERSIARTTGSSGLWACLTVAQVPGSEAKASAEGHRLPRPPGRVLTCRSTPFQRRSYSGLGHEGLSMARKRYAAEQIIGLLRQADVELGKGRNVPEFCKTLGIHESTYCRSRRKYGGLKVAQANRMKEHEQSNARLQRIVASESVDMAILMEAASGTFSALSYRQPTPEATR